MFNKSIATAFALAVSLVSAPAISATDDAAAPATIVVYRAEESSKTKRLNLDVTADSHSLGKLGANSLVVAEGAAGEYTLGTSMRGTEPLTLDLKPGATYYIHTQVKMRGTRVYVSMEQVSEQLALVQQPSLVGAI